MKKRPLNRLRRSDEHTGIASIRRERAASSSSIGARSMPASVDCETAGVAASVRVSSDGKTPAFAVVGNEGVMGIMSFLSGSALPGDVMMVLSVIDAYRLRADVARRELAAEGR